MRTGLTGTLLALLISTTVAAEEPPPVQSLRLSDAEIQLDGTASRLQLLVEGELSAGYPAGLTEGVTFAVADPAICEVSSQGLLRARNDGTTTLTVDYGSLSQQLTVTVRNTHRARQFNFENDIMPLFSRFGCSSAGCHGKAEGQNGFKLSVFGFDPAADYAALFQEARGRRVFPARPEQSLLLLKASGGSPHGGGVRIPRNSDEYRLLEQWIAAGLPLGSATDPKVVSIAVEPDQRRMDKHSRRQLRVLATYSNGRKQDVTHLAMYQSNYEALATVDAGGLVTTLDVPGEVTVMASYLGHVGLFRAWVPQSVTAEVSPAPPVLSFIDEKVDAKLQRLNITASGLCTDAEYLRRVSLDLIGTLPTAAEARRFLESSEPGKRARLVDELLQRPEYADLWALRWADLLRVDREALGHRGAYQYYRWIRQSFAENKPYDQFARELLTAEGTLREAPAGNFFQVLKTPGERAGAVSQVFLGVRIECAQCHHHPWDQWSQRDYAGMSDFFAQLSFKKAGEDLMLAAFNINASTTHPRSGEVVPAHPLGTQPPETNVTTDRRQRLAAWMTDPANRWFARNLVNRVWAYLTGRGLVEPVDDFRITNPPTNPQLLDALADSFVRSGYDIRQLIRTITASRTYQLSAEPNPTNQRDEQNFSRAQFRSLPAEVLLDAVCQTTGVGEKFPGHPQGLRATQLWDSHSPHYFLKTFGRPVRGSTCECERVTEPNISQVLHVLNSPGIQAKLSHPQGRLAQLTRQHTDDARLIDELYLTCYSRFPTPEERQSLQTHLRDHAANRRQAVEDIAWSLLNSTEFLFNH